MTRVTSAYPAPIHGVSTLAPRNRGKGQATLQENMRSDPVSKLTRRPSLDWKSELHGYWVDGGKVHSFRRRGKLFRILVRDDGTVKAYIDGVEKVVTGNLSSYVSGYENLRMANVNDTVFVVDTTKTITMDAATDATSIEAVSYINVTAALNYAETISVDVKKQDDTVTTVTHVVPDLGDPPQYDAADKARATKKVAEELATKITAITGVTAIAKGSTVAVWEDAYRHNFIHLQVETGQGDRSTVVFNGNVQSPEGIPLYAVYGSILQVKPDPTSDTGAYYLKAVSTDPDGSLATAIGNRKMEEVTWVETRSPDEPYRITQNSMPHTIFYDVTLDKFNASVPALGWDDRLVGDNSSVRVPSFVGNTIDDIQFIQKRLVFLSDNNIVMSKTGDIYDFWKRSAVKTIATDPIDISSTATGIDQLKHMALHNKDLLCVAANAQFKIPAQDALTPTNATISLTTRFDVQTDVAPVGMGNSMFFPTTYGDSSGIHEYKAEDYIEQDKGFQITHHVIGYLPGNITELVSSPNLELLVVRTDQTAANEFFVYEQFTLDNKKTQMAWSKWILPAEDDIQGMYFNGTKLELYIRNYTYLLLKEINLYDRASTSNKNAIFLDNKLELISSDGLTVTLPAYYVPYGDEVLYQGLDGTAYPLFEVGYTINGSTITFDENIKAVGASTANVFFGRPFTSRYRPTRPFVYDEKEVADTEDKIRVHAYTVAVVDTHHLDMDIISDYYDTKTVEKVARKLGLGNNKVGVIPFITDDWKYPVKQRADLAEVEFYTSGPYNLTIASIRWEGQINRSSRRI